jgi:hypothetical protein
MSKMLIDRALLEQALDALTWCEPEGAVVTAARSAAITALRAALAQQEQEPYCYIYEYDSAFGLHREFYPGPYNDRRPDRTVPVYTTPPRREWQGLTEEQVIDAVREADLDWQQGWTLEESEPNRYTQLARAIEAKLKERNHG